MMVKIPRTVHFVFGLKEQIEAFHLVHYLAIESCRQVLQPDRILLHYHHLPFGVYWDLIRPHIELRHVDPVEAVNRVNYKPEEVPEGYRYAHHADVIRLDALLEHGGVYADIDTLFLKPFPDTLFHHEFVIGREQPALNPRTKQHEASLCNALMMARPGARLVAAWREQIISALDGSWSQHSCQLAQRLVEQHPDWAHVEPEPSFLGVPLSPDGLDAFLSESSPHGALDLSQSYSVHLWQHVWWDAERTDFTRASSRDLTLAAMRQGKSQFARLAKPFLPELDSYTLDGLVA